MRDRMALERDLKAWGKEIETAERLLTNAEKSSDIRHYKRRIRQYVNEMSKVRTKLRELENV